MAGSASTGMGATVTGTEAGTWTGAEAGAGTDTGAGRRVGIAGCRGSC